MVQPGYAYDFHISQRCALQLATSFLFACAVHLMSVMQASVHMQVAVSVLKHLYCSTCSNDGNGIAYVDECASSTCAWFP